MRKILIALSLCGLFSIPVADAKKTKSDPGVNREQCLEIYRTCRPRCQNNPECFTQCWREYSSQSGKRMPSLDTCMPVIADLH